MAAILPPSGISLHGNPEVEEVKPGTSSAIILKFNKNVQNELAKVSRGKDSLQFVGGSGPKLRIGSKAIDLTLSTDAFRNELYSSTTGSASPNFTFANLVTHRGEVKASEHKTSEITSGTDAALATLQNSLASYEQEKQAKQATITNSILPTPKNRFDAARKEKMAKKSSTPILNNASRTASPSLGATSTPQLGAGPTSVPASEDEVKLRAMRTPIVHLLAMGSMSSEEMTKKTHIPKGDLASILQKVGKQSEGKWQLTDRAYKELDVWNFGYPTQEDRKAAADNAIKAFDRMRLGKDEAIWQMLLPKEERDKGRVLSRLHLGAGQANRGLTPHYQSSPLPHVDGPSESRAASAANTPRLGPSSTPKLASSKGDVMKRLLSKDPKKARAAEEAKDKKRKEREAAASDRESERPMKKQAPKKVPSNVKSAEFVHSSDDENGEEGQVNERSKGKPKASTKTAKTAPKVKAKAAGSTSPESSDTAVKSGKSTEKPAAKEKAPPKTTASPVVKASKPATTGKNTPQTKNNLSAPNSHQKSQRSPLPPNSRPSVPSPLGAARPRVASDVSDRGAVGVQKVRQGGSETPKGLGITNGARKRHDTVTSTESAASSQAGKKESRGLPAEKQQKPLTNGKSTPKAALANGDNQKTENGLKRKAEESPSQQREATSTAKHRKTDSSSSQSLNSTNSTSMASNGTARTSPNGLLDGSSSDNASSVLESITFNQGVALAEKFRDIYYPAYTKLYDEQAAMEARGEKVSKEERERLLRMHGRLEQMKREIASASQRERRDE